MWVGGAPDRTESVGHVTTGYRDATGRPILFNGVSSAPPGKSGLLLHGDRVGRYRILTHVADGGMAAVYLAELDGPSAFSKQVALKVIHRHLRADASFTRMFMDEARIAARLHHPNIVQTFDLVQDEDFLAIAMEYAPGFPASSLLPESARPLGIEVQPELVAYIGAEAAAGLHHAHTLTDTQGDPLCIVHRDVSLANVHVGFDGRVRVVDFGIARARGRLSTTGQGLVKGTFAYVAPEQFSGGEPTPPSDVWSLGVVLWELLAGRRLFRHDTEADTARAVMSAPIPPVETLRHDFPLGLGVAIHRALERDPAKRWQSAKELEERLREILPAKIEAVREPLLTALAPHREAHFDELRALIDVDEVVAIESSSERREPTDEQSTPRPMPDRGTPPTADETPMAAADLRIPLERRRGVFALGGLAAVVLAVVLAFALGGSQEARPPARARPAAVARPAPPPAAPAPPVEPARVSLDLTSGAPGAQAFLDGESLGALPVSTLVERDAGEHVLRVEAEGRQPVERRIALDSPVRLAIDLEPTPTPPTPSGPPRAPRRWRKNLTFDTNVYR